MLIKTIILEMIYFKEKIHVRKKQKKSIKILKSMIEW